MEGLGKDDDKNAIRRPCHAHAGPAAQGRPGMRLGCATSRFTKACKIDPWFMAQLAEIIDHGKRASASTACRKDAEWMRLLKSMGFSDARLAELTGKARP
jgi:carbamoyl-phosphate synthase large subunit